MRLLSSASALFLLGLLHPPLQQQQSFSAEAFPSRRRATATPPARQRRSSAIATSAAAATRGGGGGEEEEEEEPTDAAADVPRDVKVYYWNFPFWRAEVLRAGLFLQDIDFEDVRDPERLTRLREDRRAPFGALPVLEVDGRMLSQTQAMASYVGKLKNLYPSNGDPFAQARCDEIIGGCTDVTDTLAGTMYGRTPEDQVKEKRIALLDPEAPGRLHLQLSGLDSLLCRDGGPYACGADHGLTVADLAVWRLVGWLSGGVIDHIPPEFVMGFPNLSKIHRAVEAHEKMIEYKERYWNQPSAAAKAAPR